VVSILAMPLSVRHKFLLEFPIVVVVVAVVAVVVVVEPYRRNGNVGVVNLDGVIVNDENCHRYVDSD
jgi:hypothetical protein